MVAHSLLQRLLQAHGAALCRRYGAHGAGIAEGGIRLYRAAAVTGMVPESLPLADPQSGETVRVPITVLETPPPVKE